MKRAPLAVALLAGFLFSGALAQSPPDDKDAIPPRSIQLTAEQDHIIKEIVLKDLHIQQVPRSAEIKIGENVPPNIELRSFPPRGRMCRRSERTNFSSPRIRSWW
jgi:hypothetical protein